MSNATASAWLVFASSKINKAPAKGLFLCVAAPFQILRYLLPSITSLLALARVEPIRGTTQLESGHYFLCPSHHNCHLRSLAELSSSSAPLWRMAVGAVSGSQQVGSGSAGGTRRSALGAINAVGGVDELEQPAVSHTLSSSRILNPVTVYHLSFGHFHSDTLHDERLSCG